MRVTEINEKIEARFNDMDFIDALVKEIARRYEFTIIDIQKEARRRLAIELDRYTWYLSRVKKIKRIKNYRRLG